MHYPYGNNRTQNSKQSGETRADPNLFYLAMKQGKEIIKKTEGTQVRPAEAPAAGRRRKSVARRPSSHRAAADESVCSEGGSENPFNDKALIRRLLDGCILSDVVERIDRADPEQRAWDTLGSFLEIGHQLFAYVEASGRMRRDLLRAEERCQDEVARLQAKTAEVAALREALERERQDREEERKYMSSSYDVIKKKSEENRGFNMTS
ncbi:uncharacterized protein [Elaeis guineensis]|uniref:uncharacterized protein n=1 Tax=Elaeis guineensis var. tenera TaxID=51953 RepID=UPI003C6D7A1D